MIYYLDTCIWLNLFKREGDDTKGIPYWKLAEKLIQQLNANGETIIVSTIVLKELTFKMEDKFELAKTFFKKTKSIQIIKTLPEDYNSAREMEDYHGLLSFYDYLHVTIAKRVGAKLVTRDNDLILFAKDKIVVLKPEELIS
ncbi:MAG: PIN domain-containing protein [Candidatus Woesearchaeota archaeon]